MTKKYSISSLLKCWRRQ